MADHDLTIYRHLGDQVIANHKDLEVRVGYTKIKRIRSGDRIRFYNHSQEIWVAVLEVRQYSSFEQMLNYEDYRRIAPGLSEDQVLQGLLKLFPRDKQYLDVYVIEFRKD